MTTIVSNSFQNCTIVEVANNSGLPMTKGATEYGNLTTTPLVIKTGVENTKVTLSTLEFDGDYGFYTYTYTVEGAIAATIEYHLVAYKGEGGALTLPESYNGKSYVIGNGLFKDNTAITSVTIPATVTAIGDNAFKGCTNLTTVTFESDSQVAKLGAYALSSTIITYIEIPKSVTEIGVNALSWCNALETVTFESGSALKTIEKMAFYQCTALKNIVLPYGVTTIEEGVFANCSVLEEIAIPASVTSITISSGQPLFDGCKELKAVHNYSGIVILSGKGAGNDAGNYGVQENTIVYMYFNDNGVFKLQMGKEGDAAKQDTLISYTGDRAVVDLPNFFIEGRTYVIAENAFSGNESITTIVIGELVGGIADNAFSGLDNLTLVKNYSDVDIHDDNKVNYGLNGSVEVRKYKIVDDRYIVIVGATSDVLESFTDSETAVLTLPDEFTTGHKYEIGENAFGANTNLTKIVIPANVTAIAEGVFSGCTNLLTVENYSGVEIAPGTYGLGEDATVNMYTGGFQVKVGKKGESDIVTGYSTTGSYTPKSGGGYSLRASRSVDLIAVFPNKFVNDTYIIAEGVFTGTMNITAITFGTGLKGIEDGAFSGITNLTIHNYSATFKFSTLTEEKKTSIGIAGEGVTVIVNDYTVIGGFAVAEGTTEDTVTKYVGDETEVTLPEYFTQGKTYVIAADAFSGKTITTVNNNGRITVKPGEYGLADTVIVYQTIGDFKVQIGKTSDIVVGYVGTATEIVFPEKFVNDTYTIADGASERAGVFSEKQITSVTFGKGLTEIGDHAFDYCNNLASITFAENGNLEIIGLGAFSNCYKLVTLVIPDSVTTIETNAFRQGNSLVSVTLGNGLKTIEDAAFSFSYIVEVINNSTIDLDSAIGTDMHGNVAQYALTVQKGGESKLTVGTDGYVFYTHTYREEGATQDTTKYYLVGYTGSETKLTLPADFNGNTYEIYKRALDRNNSIKQITIPQNVTAIHAGAFENDKQLQTVTFKEGSLVTKVGIDAFYGCSELAFNVDDSGAKYLGTATNPYLVLVDGTAVSTGYTVNATTKVIADSAFSGNKNVTGITIPSSVQYIGDNAFDTCRYLKAVYNGSTLDIVKGALTYGRIAYYAEYLYTLSTLDSFTYWACQQAYVADNANTYDVLLKVDGAVTELTLPKALTNGRKYTLGSGAFANCAKLTTIYNYSGTAITSDDRQTYGIADSVKVYNYYVTEEGFEYFSSDVYDDKDESTYDIVLGYHGTDKALSLPDEFTQGRKYVIGDDAFKDRYDLTSVTLSEGLVSIGDGAFANCAPMEGSGGLTAITIPSTVKYIGTNAFNACTNLATVTFAENSQLVSIGEGAFFNCETLGTIVIPDSVTSIGKNAFAGCLNLTAVTINQTSKLETIGERAFDACLKVTELTIPASVTSIGNNAFSDMTSLNTVYNYSNIVIKSGDYGLGTGVTIKNFKIVNGFTVEIGETEDKIVGYAGEGTTLTLPEYFTKGHTYTIDSSVTFGTNITEVNNYGNVSFKPGNYGTSSYNTTVYKYVGGFKAQVNVYVSEGYRDLVIAYEGDTEIVVFPDKFESDTYVIGASLFQDNRNLYSVTLGKGLYQIGYNYGGWNTFEGCNRLAEIINLSDYIPVKNSDGDDYYGGGLKSAAVMKTGGTSGVVKQGAYVFLRYENGEEAINYLLAYTGTLTELTLPLYDNNGTKEGYDIHKYAFVNNKELTKVVIPAGVKEIGTRAFNGCSNLEEVILPDGLTTIGSNAFLDCTNLSTLSLPDSIMNVVESSEQAFENTKLFRADNDCYYVDSNGAQYYGNKNNPCLVLISAINVYNTNTYTVNSKTKVIAGCAFDDAYSVKTVIIPDSVESFSDDAFYGSSVNDVISEGNNLKYIGSAAFISNKYISNFVVPEGVTYIGDNAFNNSSLTEITIPATVTTIGRNAFSKCNSLTAIYNYTSIIFDSAKRTELGIKDTVAIYNKVTTAEGIVYTEGADGEIVIGYTGNETELTLPEYFTEGHAYVIADGAFTDSGITTVYNYSALDVESNLAKYGFSDTVTVVKPE